MSIQFSAINKTMSSSIPTTTLILKKIELPLLSISQRVIRKTKEVQLKRSLTGHNKLKRKPRSLLLLWPKSKNLKNLKIPFWFRILSILTKMTEFNKNRNERKDKSDKNKLKDRFSSKIKIPRKWLLTVWTGLWTRKKQKRNGSSLVGLEQILEVINGFRRRKNSKKCR